MVDPDLIQARVMNWAAEEHGQNRRRTVHQAAKSTRYEMPLEHRNRWFQEKNHAEVPISGLTMTHLALEAASIK